MPVGSLAAPLAERQYGAKFDECAERFIPPGELAELKGELGKLADLESIAPVMDRLARRAVDTMADTRYTALVLAATRGGARDPLAQEGGVSHKAFIDLAGKPMLRRVVESVIDSGRVGRIIVSIEQDAMDEAKQVLAGLDEPGADRLHPVARKHRRQRRRARAVAPGRAADDHHHRRQRPAHRRDRQVVLRPARCRDRRRRARPHRRERRARQVPRRRARLPPLPRRAVLELQPLRLPQPEGVQGRGDLQRRRPVRQEAQAADRRLRAARVPGLQVAPGESARRSSASSRAPSG